MGWTLEKPLETLRVTLPKLSVMALRMLGTGLAMQLKTLEISSWTFSDCPDMTQSEVSRIFLPRSCSTLIAKGFSKGERPNAVDWFGSIAPVRLHVCLRIEHHAAHKGEL